MKGMRIGEYQEMRVVRDSPHGFYLDDAEEDAILLPKGQTPRNLQIGDDITVFVYTDSEDRPIATTQKPHGVVGDFVRLRVVSSTGTGAFLDWGLDKDLFCPIREQSTPLRDGETPLVRIYLDERSNRVSCSTKISKFLETDGRDQVELGQPVPVMIAAKTRDMIIAIIDGRLKASIFPDEWHEKFEIGEIRQAYVKSVREDDGKVALSLRPQGFRAVLGEQDRVIAALEEAGGYLPVTDRSSPEEIHHRFGLSKGAFKKLIGNLYRRGMITLETRGIRLNR